MKLNIVDILLDQHPDETPQEPPVYDYTVIYAVGENGSVHILKHGIVPDCLSEDIQNWESFGVDSNEAPGVYKGTFTWDKQVHWESGIDEGNFVLDDASECLYLLPDLN